ncbi:MAG: 4Fe-4S binding protein [Clostridia bacterium]|nr:4Fe-4S binding protein [Clostridia bacterium]MBN2883404.1 4Fe-4S binding protein [Clostridia bacterium]
MVRKIVQSLTAVVSNSYITGFLKGTIYQGKLKNVCVPGLNCYSCPGALGSCPIGSLQAVIGSAKYRFSFYVTGLILLFGGFLGRWICGWICPFGLLQELLHKVPGKKIRISGNWKKLSWIRYIMLFVFVIGLPLFVVNIAGYGSPAFCKYVCPAGTIEAALPLILAAPDQFGSLGGLFILKASIAAVVVIASIFIYRPFCTMLCPLGLIYGWMNKISMYQMQVDKDKCIECGKCRVACKLDIEIYKNPTSMECIRCGECKPVCPTNAISSGIKFRTKAEGAASFTEIEGK